MVKGIQWFIGQMVERFVPIIGSMFSSTVEAYQALGLAEQQSQLEEAARRYEADGKNEIAAMLRDRASQLSSNDPAANALQIAENVTSRPLLLHPDDQSAEREAPRLTQSNKSSTKARRKKSSATNDTPNSTQLPPLNTNPPE